MPESQARQNYHVNSEAGVNKQINVLLNCSYVYHSMAWYFDRDDVALKGFFEFLKDASCKKREFAEKMMKYQNQRGGRIVLQDIKVITEMWLQNVTFNMGWVPIYRPEAGLQNFKVSLGTGLQKVSSNLGTGLQKVSSKFLTGLQNFAVNMKTGLQIIQYT
ncbi:soma ferritin isoform X2 [Haliotis rufescens]|uniref:soma ferritin isoform X2 n=1 Tax=Haliotis rufescens TaxID=6454 RepID=UPI001EAFA59F|nr:soma ferritin isoform X2 [Haliotis rufescens]